MNTELTIATTSNTTLTMSSREIAELTGKRHDNVRADIEKMGLELSLKFQEKVEPSVGGRPSRVYYLTKRETMILVSGYSIPLRARIIDRWMELEAAAVQSQPATHKIPTNYVEALRLAADEAERRQKAEEALDKAKPLINLGGKVEKVRHTLARAVRSYEGVNANLTKRDLLAAGYLYRDHNGTYRVYSRYRTEHFIERTNEYGKIDIYVGTKGHHVLDQLYREGRLTMLKAYA